ncbi:META domain-containing protein [Prosthecochloris sp. SCSIO W1101]|uniref:META domain-containing protein n=1 Tax=Prosthecochloris sp. SCSIO W1101 TaxID=2992242 RepID=UPI00223E3940|nr:META domain-containing protein [Prosthecochloris sp. SCSIO W1101]UZJ42555.1 META domain-containing protein [Prosthecochloris sp. SCSIO W1101]
MKRYLQLSPAVLMFFLLTSSLFLLSSCSTDGAKSEKEAVVSKEDEGAGKQDVSEEKVNPLAETQWRLVEFQSMDDETGTQRPSDPSLYTMELKGDSTVHMRLNCNYANGTWTSEASSDPSNGSFEFGPLAMTNALCPPPSMDEQIASHAQYVRSYLLKEGKLYLSLMADGGIYVWEPHGETP